jgi:hypothetical protein
MVEGNLEAARPRARRPRKASASVQKQATDTIFKGLDRFGLAPIVLLVGGWWAASKIIEPLIAEYREAIRTISETNRLLKDEITQNDAEDGRRVEAITNLQNENRALLLAIQKQLEELANK